MLKGIALKTKPPTPAYATDPGAKEAPGKPEERNAADPRKIKPNFSILDFIKTVLKIVPRLQFSCHARRCRAIRRCCMA